MKLSVVIPARNEAESLPGTVAHIAEVLGRERVPYEIVIVDDGSTDETGGVARALAARDANIRSVVNRGPHGFGYAVRAGFAAVTGEAAAIMMADSSDSAEDLLVYYRELEKGAECVFGSRFIAGSRVIDYPAHKLLVNRLANWFISMLFGIGYNDTTNAFKAYRRHVIDGLQPLISPHFNLTVEMPLKAIIRGYHFAVVPISWQNRTTGISKLKLREMGSRYLFIVLYLWLEKHLSRGDYRRADTVARADRPASQGILPHA